MRFSHYRRLPVTGETTEFVSRKHALASSLALIVAGGGISPVLGQDESEAVDEGVIEEIIVRATGTNISGVAPVGSQVMTLDALDIEAVGVTDIADVLRTLPQVQRNPGRSQNSLNSNATSIMGNLGTRGDAIDLRGVGDDATLLLINGRRFAGSGPTRTYSEAVTVPMSAIERVEVIADGASAIYGSDAIAGVVNYVLRDDYQGMEINASYGSNEYGDDWRLGAMGGQSWQNLGSMGRGNVLFTYERIQENPIYFGEVPRLRRDQSPFGGIDGRTSNDGRLLSGRPTVVLDNPGVTNPVFPWAGEFTFYGVPEGVDNPTFADIAPLENMPDLISASDFEDWRGETERDLLAISFNQEIKPGVDIFGDARYSRRDTYTRMHEPTGQPGNYATNLEIPYWLNDDPATGTVHPLWFDAGQGDQNPMEVTYNVLANLPDGLEFAHSTNDENVTGTAGVRVDLSAEWAAEFAYTYSRAYTCSICYFDTYVNRDTTDQQGRPAADALQRAVNENFINPFSTQPLTNTQWDRIKGTNFQRSQFYNHLATLRFDGPLFELPGGTMRAAVGGEFQDSTQKVQNGANRPPNNLFLIDANTDYGREQHSAFGEIYLPVVGPSMGVPFMQSLVFSGAARYDDYSDFGNTTNPKIGMTWGVNDDLNLRAAWGTSFRAPGIPEVQPGVVSVVLLGQPFVNNSGLPGIPGLPFLGGQSLAANLVFGGNPNLGPEEGENLSFGFDWTPEVGPGELRVSGTWYQIDYTNRLGPPPNITTVFASPESAAQYSSQYQVLSHAANCDNTDPATWDPFVRDLLGSVPPYRVNIFGVCSSSVYFDGRQTNIAGTLQEGLDVQLNYRFATDVGLFSFGGNMNLITKSTIQARSDLPAQSNLDGDNGLGNGPISLRARADVGWSNGPWGVNLFANHTGDFRVVPATIFGVTASADVPSWTTFDLNFNYDFDSGSQDIAGLSGVRVSLSVNNITDRQPPVVLTGNGTSSVHFAHDVTGRNIRLSVTKAIF